MTCIVGLVEKSEVWLGGDTAAFVGWDIIPGSVKVFHNGPCLIGCSGDVRSTDLLRFTFTVPTHPTDMPVERYVRTLFVDALRDCFKAAGYAQKEKEQEQHESLFLVAYRGRLFAIYGGYGVVESSASYDAIGIGDDFAKGALFASAGLDARARIFLALQAAEAHSSGVRGPFTIEVLEPEPDQSDTLLSVAIATQDGTHPGAARARPRATQSTRPARRHSALALPKME